MIYTFAEKHINAVLANTLSSLFDRHPYRKYYESGPVIVEPVDDTLIDFKVNVDKLNSFHHFVSVLYAICPIEDEDLVTKKLIIMHEYLKSLLEIEENKGDLPTLLNDDETAAYSLFITELENKRHIPLYSSHIPEEDLLSFLHQTAIKYLPPEIIAESNIPFFNPEVVVTKNPYRSIEI